MTRHLAPQTTSGEALNIQGDLATRLRTAIVNGDFSPSDRLKFADLSDQFGAGYGTLREALSRLTTEGYVTQEINRGFAVAPVSEPELSEVTEHLIDLEQRAIASAIVHGDDSWEADIVAAHHRLNSIEKRAWEERVAQHHEWVIRHKAFHEALVATCVGPWLLKMRAMMFDQFDRYRFLTKMAKGDESQSRASEHRMLMEAALDRDIEGASSIIDAHIRTTSQSAIPLLAALEQNE